MGFVRSGGGEGGGKETVDLEAASTDLGGVKKENER